MNLLLDVLIWIAENIAWWWLLVASPLASAWLWWRLRATGRHRATGPAGVPEPAQAAPPVVADEDTIVFQRVAYPGGETDR
ncbi:hypothetical protein AQJ30_15840 [Streptomyces longwoodensis]|uniref:Uncharacterized protein n=1 Tax=Streptomyces longwoodensis TaxID=68231 RepID=A0A117QNA2_9ACTN|nr:hypothetical protein [Streptomyces longwoodensis]KUN37752.1 hypothetical protein AQJ30_15840 [Streptomyces longwoodensis]